ncbi:hypothetical protein [Rossellomorea vietnamensis]|uniref:hypothetical protein n=1 Tax=Rossellomorea vietnamensis TaxID=218284 RepID=UPI0016535013|nr:hypothetical protein [Rossellomorea vietnamensis]
MAKNNINMTIGNAYNKAGLMVCFYVCFKKSGFAKIVAALNEVDFRSRWTTPRGGR